MTTLGAVLHFSGPRAAGSGVAGKRNTRSGNGGLSAQCLPLILTLEELDQFGDAIRPLPPLRKRDVLFQQGSPFTSLFIVRSGSVKQFTAITSGEDQVTSFFLPSELAGLDGLADQRYPGTAVALETTTLYEIPFERLDSPSVSLSKVRGQLYRSMSREMHNERLMMRLLLRKTADVRLASFLVSMSMRFRRRGYSPFCFRLAMSRGDIGNYLGLAVETVSRCLGRFQREELVATHGREFHIRDLDALMRLADGDERCD